MRKDKQRTPRRFHRQARTVIGGLLLAVTFSACATAASPRENETIVIGRVAVNDLDLTRDADVSVLEKRVEMKVRRYCSGRGLLLSTPGPARKCRNRVLAENGAKIDQAIAEAEQSASSR